MDEKSLYAFMDQELKIQHPDLKKLIDLMMKLSFSLSESPNQFEVCLEEEMEVGGIGCQDNFTLTWERLSVALIIKGLSEPHCQAILNKYSGYDVAIIEPRAYLKTFFHIESLAHIQQGLM